nr:uncharacterized protein LOC113825103 [Penaeus vannamei]
MRLLVVVGLTTMLAGMLNPGEALTCYVSTCAFRGRGQGRDQVAACGGSCAVKYEVDDDAPPSGGAPPVPSPPTSSTSPTTMTMTAPTTTTSPASATPRLPRPPSPTCSRSCS